jgi:hypothetical protein
MRATLLACALGFAACAGQPTTTAPAPAAAADQPQQAAPDAELEKKRLAEAMKHGYKVVNTQGDVLYCRSDWATGSHIQKTTVCLTAQQLDDLDRRNQQTLDIPNVGPGKIMP